MKGNNSHLKTFFSGSLISIVGVGITGVLNYFIRRTLFMNMSEADYGTFYSAVAFLLMVGGFAELGLSQTGALLIAENNTGSQKTRKISSCFSSLLSLKLILATVVLILLLSCSRWILKDYLLTNKATQSFREQWLQMLRDKGENEVVVENRRALGSVSVDYLNQTIDLINTNYGNVQNYLTEYFDLSPTDLKQLQQLYLD